MKFYPSLEEIKEVSKKGGYKAAPICGEIFSDIITPIELLRKIKGISKQCYMLESAEENKNFGRYTFLSYDPKLEFTCVNKHVSIKGEHEIEIDTESPAQYIREILDEYKSPNFQGMPSFTGGLVGYFSYDYIKYLEPSLKLKEEAEPEFMDVDLMLFDKVIVFDNYAGKLILIQNIALEDIENEYQKGCEKIVEMAKLIKNETERKEYSGAIKSDFRYLFRKREYEEIVEKAKKHIFEGDIFQVVLSNRMEADYEGSLFNAYRVLRTLNPSPYMFYFSSDEQEITGASPETLVKLENGKLFTFPLAGTRKRGDNIEEDEALEKDLLADEKETAEHNMLVDLGRNDLGKISKFGSVKVEKYMEIQKYSHVMHIGSTVSGQIKEDKDGIDAIGAVLPAGTLSGAPKIRACEIINELENNKRGIYGGAIGYLDFKGNMDTCIAIRLAYRKKGKVYIRSGAGIVADSNPEKEYLECVNKAKAVVNAINIANGGELE